MPTEPVMSIASPPVANKNPTNLQMGARGVNAVTTTGLEVEKDPPVSYLATSPDLVIDHIVRCVSASPRHTEWMRYIASSDVQSLLLCSGVLGDRFRRQFKSLELRKREFYTTDTNQVTLFLSDSQLRIVEILERAGQFLENFQYYGDGQILPPPQMDVWIEPFTRHCNNVRHLTLSNVHPEVFERILAARSGSLKTLQLTESTSFRDHLNSVIRHCVGLKNLSFSVNIEIPETFWQIIGPSLVELELMKRMLPGICKSVQDHCRQLRRFSCYDLGIRSYGSEFISLLKSYGEQLEFAKGNFTRVPTQELSSIASECPNCVFETFDRLRSFTQCVTALHYRVHDLTIRGLKLPIPDNFFTNLVGIRKLSLYLNYSECAYVLINMWREPKPDLVEVNISICKEKVYDLVDILAAHTKALKNVNLSLKTLPSEESIRKLLQNNPLMETLKIAVHESDFESTIAMLRTCAEAGTRLKSLHLNRRKKPKPPPPPPPEYSDLVRSQPRLNPAFHVARYADECLPMRHRNTFVHVFGIDVIS